MGEPLLSHAVRAAKWARGAAVRARRRAELIDTVPALGARARSGPPLRPVHLSLLGGRTLNVALPCPAPVADTAEVRLHLESHGRVEQLPLEREPQPDGGTLLTLTTSLRHARHDAPTTHGPRLDDGLWRMSLVAVDHQGRIRRTPIAALHEAVSDGPTLRTPRTPPPGCTTAWSAPSTATPWSRSPRRAARPS